MFLVTYLGGEEYLNTALIRRSPQDHIFPMQLRCVACLTRLSKPQITVSSSFFFLSSPCRYCCRPWRMGADFMYYTKVGTLQYVVLKPLTAIVTFVLESLHLYGEVRDCFLFFCLEHSIVISACHLGDPASFAFRTNFGSLLATHTWHSSPIARKCGPFTVLSFFSWPIKKNWPRSNPWPNS
jgi:hypothetical protein